MYWNLQARKKSCKFYTILPFTRNSQSNVLERALSSLLWQEPFQLKIHQVVSLIRKNRIKQFQQLTISLSKKLIYGLKKVEKLTIYLHHTSTENQQLDGINLIKILNFKPNTIQNIAIVQLPVNKLSKCPQLQYSTLQLNQESYSEFLCNSPFSFINLLQYQSESLITYQVQITKQIQTMKSVILDANISQQIMNALPLTFVKLQTIIMKLHFINIDEPQVFSWIFVLKKTITENQHILMLKFNLANGVISNAALIPTLSAIIECQTIRFLSINLKHTQGCNLEESIEKVMKSGKFARFHIETLAINFTGHIIGDHTLQFLQGILQRCSKLRNLKLKFCHCNLTYDQIISLIIPKQLHELHLDLNGNAFIIPDLGMIRSILSEQSFIQKLTINLSGGLFLQTSKLDQTGKIQNSDLKHLQLNLSDLPIRSQVHSFLITLLNDLPQLNVLKLVLKNSRLRDKAVGYLLSTILKLKNLIELDLDLRYNIFSKQTYDIANFKGGLQLINLKIKADQTLERIFCELGKQMETLLRFEQTFEADGMKSLLFIRRKVVIWIHFIRNQSKFLKTDVQEIRNIWKTLFIIETIPFII